MYISRMLVRNFRNFEKLDVNLQPGITCLIGENNTGKSNLLFGLRLAIDSNLSSTYRVLTEHDIYSGISISHANQVIVSVEFSDYFDQVNETALVGCWEVDDKKHIARLTYRFRPKQSVREALEEKEFADGNLTLEDYHWELTGGGIKDPGEITWSEDLGTSIRFSDLQQFHVVFLHALRDVNQDLRQSRQSPLGKLIEVSEIEEEEKDELVEIMKRANKEISKTQSIHETGEIIEDAFKKTAGEAFDIEVKLGMVDPSFASITRSLTLLLTNDALKDFEPYRNGLGLNNILYISMLIESFERRVKNATTAGQILLIEEPEAHLHPQLQRVLFEVLKNKPFQTIISSHSTHITSSADLSSVIILTNTGEKGISGNNPCYKCGLSTKEIDDLERYLDATRSSLLYARKVILVEGPAELFVIPPLVKKIMGIDLERHGISIIPIYGVHFDAYAKLFSEWGMPKKCAIIADGDLRPSDSEYLELNEDTLVSPGDVEALSNDYVHVFKCSTTFEKALTIPGFLLCLSKAAIEFGAKNLGGRLKETHNKLRKEEYGREERIAVLKELKESVLTLSKRIGKARFAQIVSRHIDSAESIPKYVKDAVDWLVS
jgi:putative ATP-dependent endonuclease of OLD family